MKVKHLNLQKTPDVGVTFDILLLLLLYNTFSFIIFHVLIGQFEHVSLWNTSIEHSPWKWHTEKLLAKAFEAQIQWHVLCISIKFRNLGLPIGLSYVSQNLLYMVHSQQFHIQHKLRLDLKIIMGDNEPKSEYRSPKSWIIWCSKETLIDPNRQNNMMYYFIVSSINYRRVRLICHYYALLFLLLGLQLIFDVCVYLSKIALNLIAHENAISNERRSEKRIECDAMAAKLIHQLCRYGVHASITGTNKTEYEESSTSL